MLSKTIIVKLSGIVLCVFFVSNILTGCVVQSVKLNEENKSKIKDIILVIKKPRGMSVFGRSLALIRYTGGPVIRGEIQRSQTDMNNVRLFSELIKPLDEYVQSEKILNHIENKTIEMIRALFSANISKVVVVNNNSGDDFQEILQSMNQGALVYVEHEFAFPSSMQFFEFTTNVSIYNKSKINEAEKIYSNTFIYQTLPAMNADIRASHKKLDIAYKEWSKNSEDEELSPKYPFDSIVDVYNAYASYWADNGGEKLRKTLNAAISESNNMIKMDINNQSGTQIISLPYLDGHNIQPLSKYGNRELEGALLKESGRRAIIRGPKGVLFSLRITKEPIAYHWLFKSP